MFQNSVVGYWEMNVTDVILAPTHASSSMVCGVLYDQVVVNCLWWMGAIYTAQMVLYQAVSTVSYAGDATHFFSRPYIALTLLLSLFQVIHTGLVHAVLLGIQCMHVHAHLLQQVSYMRVHTQ